MNRRNRILSLLKIPRDKRDELASRIFRRELKNSIYRAHKFQAIYDLVDRANLVEEMRHVRNS